MKNWKWFVIPFVIVSAMGGAAAILTYQVSNWPCESYEPVEFFDLDLDKACVTTTGTAHYEVVVTQKVPGNGFFEDKTYYVYGLFPKGNTDEREIRVLVRTERAPERMVSFETMTLSGRLNRMDYQKVPFDTERRMGQRSHYYFSDRVVLLEPDRIEVKGEPVWERLPAE